MSRFPVGGPGWSVGFGCPSYLSAGAWTCVGHLTTLGGADSYWKVLWRYGEEYPNVVATVDGPEAFSLAYSPTTTMGSFQTLW
jgi:hypothetical protein